MCVQQIPKKITRLVRYLFNYHTNNTFILLRHPLPYSERMHQASFFLASRRVGQLGSRLTPVVAYICVQRWGNKYVTGCVSGISQSTVVFTTCL